MNDDLVLVDEEKSIQWNYVNRVEKELATCNDYRKITINPLIPQSYKDVVMTLSKACNHSRVALLIDNEEQYVAFMMVVDDDCIPFLLEPLDDIETPVRAIYKVFTDSSLATSKGSDGTLQKFIKETVIPDLNTDIESWKPFRYDETDD